MSLSFLQDFAPLAVLAAGGAACAGTELRSSWSATPGRPLSRWLSLATLALAFLACVGFWHSSVAAIPPDVEHGSFLVDRFALFFDALALGAAAALVLCGADGESELQPHAGAYHALLLTGVAGVLMTGSAADLTSLGVGLCLTSLPLCLALGLHKTDSAGLRIGLRSLVTSGLLLALFLGGEAILAGLAGTTQLRGLASALNRPDPLLTLAALMLLVGGAGQLGAFPFGVWRAQESDTGLGPSTARTLLVGLAVLAALLRLFPGALGDVSASWTMPVALLAGLTLITAPLLALRQGHLSRVVPHLIVAQLALGLAALPEASPRAAAGVLYLLICVCPLGAASLGLLGCLQAQGEGDGTTALRGLAARSPVLAGLLALLLAALAGLPPLAGFFARLFSVEASLKAGLGWLAWLAVLSALISVAVAFRWLLVLFDVRASGLVVELPGTTVLVGVVACELALVAFALLLGPLMGIAARGALPPLIGP